MFTEETYHEYFWEIYRKEREAVNVLHGALGQIARGRMREALAGHMELKMRHAALMEELARSIAGDFEPPAEAVLKLAF